MKVLMFGWEFPPFISGGLGTACFGICKALLEQGVEIDFVLPKMPPHVDKTPLSQSLQMINASNVPIENTIFKDNAFSSFKNSFSTSSFQTIEVNSVLQPYQNAEEYSKSYDSYIKRYHELLGNSPTLHSNSYTLDFEGNYGKNLFEEVQRMTQVGYALGKNTNASVIHAHDWMTFPVATAAKYSSNLPFIAHVHATVFDRNDHSIDERVYAIEKEGMEHANIVVAVSHRTKQTIVEKYGIPKEKIIVIHNGKNKKEKNTESIYQKKFDEPVVLFLGRITNQKGPAIFLEIARLILEKKPKVKFVMAGDGDLFPEMIVACAKMRIQEHFHFTGFLKGDQLDHIFSISDVFVMPSISEPFGLVPLEAMEYDLPVLISKQSGVAEVLPNAIKIDFWDAQKFANEILGILKSSSRKKKYVESNKVNLENISWDLTGQKLKHLYEEV